MKKAGFFILTIFILLGYNCTGYFTIQTIEKRTEYIDSESMVLPRGSPGPIIAHILEFWANARNLDYQQPATEWEVEIYRGILDETKEISTILIVDDEGDGEFTSIQQAVDTSGNNTAILVYSGLYEESVSIEKPVWLLGIPYEYENGSDEGKPVLQGSNQDTIQINADAVCIAGLNIESNHRGVFFSHTSQNIILYNNTVIITENGSGISGTLFNSLIKQNQIYGRNYSNFGLQIPTAENITIVSNTIQSFDIAFSLSDSQNIQILMNSFSQSRQNALNFADGTINNTTISKNNFIKNHMHVYKNQSCYINNVYWNNQEKGNYWDTYTGIDHDANGIGDEPYSIIDSLLIDLYPLMTLFQNHPPIKPLINPDEQGILCGKTDQEIPVFAKIEDADMDNLSYKWIWGNKSDSWHKNPSSQTFFQTTHRWNSTGLYPVSIYMIHLMVMDEHGYVSVSLPYEIHIYDLTSLKNPLMHMILDTLLPSYFLSGWQ